MDTKRNNKEIGLRINKIRLDKGMTLDEFGKLFGASKSSVYGWEKGRNLPNKERLKQIAKIGDISISQLLKGDVSYNHFMFPNFMDVNTNKELEKYAIQCVEIIRDETPDVRAEDLFRMFFISICALIEKALRDNTIESSVLIGSLPLEKFTNLLSKKEWVTIDSFVGNFFEIPSYDTIYNQFTFNDLKFLRKVLLKIVEVF